MRDLYIRSLQVRLFRKSVIGLPKDPLELGTAYFLLCSVTSGKAKRLQAFAFVFFLASIVTITVF